MSFGFGKAMDVMRLGDAVTRMAWGSDTFLMFVPGSEITVEADRPLGKANPRMVGENAVYASHIDIVTRADGYPRIQPWQPSQEAVMADDWDYVR